MKLQLDPIKEKILEIEKPNGQIIKLKIKSILVGEAEAHENKQKKLTITAHQLPVFIPLHPARAE